MDDLEFQPGQRVVARVYRKLATNSEEREITVYKGTVESVRGGWVSVTLDQAAKTAVGMPTNKLVVRATDVEADTGQD